MSEDMIKHYGVTEDGVEEGCFEQSGFTQSVGEQGQTIVLIVFMIIGLLAFVGIAADVGFLFARTTQFAAAVDAASLAGVVELHTGGLPAAQGRAEQFLNANGWPVSETLSLETSKSFTNFGIPQFTVTATWPVETFFLRVIGFDDIPVTRSATAAYYASTEIPTPTQLHYGKIDLAGQFLFGDDSCTMHGDPVVPIQSDNSGAANPTYSLTEGRYQYRILIPESYINDIGDTVMIQLFDPDTWNNPGLAGGSHDYEKIDGSTVTGASCSIGSASAGDNCIIETGEPENPVWLVRVDEGFKVNSSGSNFCPVKDFNKYQGASTRYELYYRNENQVRVDIASFDGNTNPFATDLQWVTPGIDVGSGGSFKVNLMAQGVPQDGFGNYNLYLDVTSESGMSKNVWDLWAGPPELVETLFLHRLANQRNLRIARTDAVTTTGGVQTYALGYMPTNIFRTGQVELPLGVVAESRAGGGMYASVFDFDEGDRTDDFEFYFDEVSKGDFYISHLPECEVNLNCDNKWLKEQVEMLIPGPQVNVAFYGGTLLVKYNPTNPASGVTDLDHTWSMSVTSGRPFLTD